jgi:hypothetical protein
MKSLMMTVAMVATLFTTYAQSDKYTAAMQKTLAMMDSAKSTQDFTNVSNAFERIGEAEKTQWLPYYYAGLALTTAAWSDASIDKDKNSDKINALVDKGEAIEKNSELCTVRNMAATQQMLINPQERWQTYGQKASSALEEGKKLDPNNPRLYYLQGMSLFGTPEQFGGGKVVAKPVFEKAEELFKQEKPKPLYPGWGQKQTEDMIEKCK